jgi:hypothetical protein
MRPFAVVMPTSSSAPPTGGALATIGATTAHTLAHELERIGQASHLDGSQSVLHKLEAELAQLAAFFAEPRWIDRL